MVCRWPWATNTLVSLGHLRLAQCSFGPPSGVLVVVTWNGEVQDAVGIYFKNSATNKNQGADVKYMG